jgi:hypothetical protein
MSHPSLPYVPAPRVPSVTLTEPELDDNRASGCYIISIISITINILYYYYIISIIILVRIPFLAV